jgi:hypothetical protein
MYSMWGGPLLCHGQGAKKASEMDRGCFIRGREEFSRSFACIRYTRDNNALP